MFMIGSNRILAIQLGVPHQLFERSNALCRMLHAGRIEPGYGSQLFGNRTGSVFEEPTALFALSFGIHLSDMIAACLQYLYRRRV